MSDPRDADLSVMSQEELALEVLRLRKGIREHRDEHGHGRCWLDDDRLYALLPDQRDGNSQLPPRDTFLANCARFWSSRQPPQIPISEDTVREIKLKSGNLLVVSPCVPGDIPGIVALDRSLWGESANSPYLYRQLIDIYPQLVLVAREPGGAVAGCAVGLLAADCSRGWVLSMDVDSRYHGQGAGGALLDHLIGVFERYGVDDVTAIVSAKNGRSLKMFSRRGFEAVGEEAGYFDAGDLQIRMQRIIK